MTNKDNINRRKLLFGLTAGVAGASQLPAQWTRPIVDSVLLPAHAQTSTTTTTAPTTTPVACIDPVLDSGNVTVADSLVAAKSALMDMGFMFDDAHPSIYMGKMHNLPNAVRREAGLDISIELHHQVYSRDNSVSLGYEQARKNTRPISINNQNMAFTLDHVSMLNHLCRHTFGPADEVRIIHQFDILKYTQKFINEINWSELHNEYTFIVNTLRCLHFSLALPAQIKEKIDIPETSGPQGVGQSLLPYSKIFATRQTVLSAQLHFYCHLAGGCMSFTTYRRKKLYYGVIFFSTLND